MMRNRSGNKAVKQSRRKFFSLVMRGAIGAGLAVTGGYLLFKEKPAESCSLDFTCTLCGKTDQCALPAAKSYRKYEQQKQETR